MQTVLAIFLVLFIAGILWSLWYVLTNPRRRARQVAAELSAPVIRTLEPLVVGYNRWANGVGALFFAILLVNVVSRSHGAATIVLGVVIFAPLATAFGWFAISSRPVLVISGEGIIVSRPRRRLRWEDVQTIAIEEGRGFAGVEEYNLVLRLMPEGVTSEPDLGGREGIESETITTGLALLSPNWHEIARAIRERSGRQPIIPSRYKAQNEAHFEP